MRIPILTGLLLASAWTACAQSFPTNGILTSSAVSNTIDPETTTTQSPTTPTGAVFEFVAFPRGDDERLYDQSQNLSPIIRIKISTSSYENIELYIRNDDGDALADTITGAANASGSAKGLISVIPAGESFKDVMLNFGNIVASGDGHAFFLVLQANAGSSRTHMGSEGLEDIATSPLFGVVKDESSSTSFEAEDISGSEPANIQNGSPSGASETTGNAAFNPTATASTSSSSKSKKSGGLATGAIAGIAVGAAIVLIIVIAAIWFILRRRKQQAHSHHADAATPLAAGYGGAAAATGSRDFMGEKEPDPRHSALSGAAIIGGATAAPANASYAESGHQAYDEAVPAGHSPTDQQPPHHGSAGGIHGVDSPVPSASVARHLVDEDMTADEIARLEEEERELDRQIQEAGRRRQ